MVSWPNGLIADDLKVYTEITNVNDCSNLQKSLDVISMWAKDWQLERSVEKCNILQVGPCLVNY